MEQLILRQAAIDALRTCYDTKTITMDNGDEYINYGDAVGEIEQLPPIQPKLLQPWEVLAAQAVLSQPAEPKRGKWIKYEQEFMLEGSLGTVQKTVRECSVCTAKIAGMVGIMNFCPNCGADMRQREVTE